MEIMKVKTPLRGFFLVVATVILLGIWLTGFDAVHWVLYVPLAMLTLGGVTGICPGLGLWRTLLGSK